MSVEQDYVSVEQGNVSVEQENVSVGQDNLSVEQDVRGLLFQCAITKNPTKCIGLVQS